jgi:transcriptional regulator GlxA family with amidase domain
VAELARWRLKRAIDYVEAQLDKPVSLADVASSAGLTRMHFAAQFKAATGLRPHEYLLRRRIERAQEMLVGTDMSLVDVALSVGFQTQAHFTSVFKRYAGQSPRAWRESRVPAHMGREIIVRDFPRPFDAPLTQAPSRL